MLSDEHVIGDQSTCLVEHGESRFDESMPCYKASQRTFSRLMLRAKRLAKERKQVNKTKLISSSKAAGEELRKSTLTAVSQDYSTPNSSGLLWLPKNCSLEDANHVKFSHSSLSSDLNGVILESTNHQQLHKDTTGIISGMGKLSSPSTFDPVTPESRQLSLNEITAVALAPPRNSAFHVPSSRLSRQSQRTLDQPGLLQTTGQSSSWPHNLNSHGTCSDVRTMVSLEDGVLILPVRPHSLRAAEAFSFQGPSSEALSSCLPAASLASSLSAYASEAGYPADTAGPDTASRARGDCDWEWAATAAGWLRPAEVAAALSMVVIMARR